MVTVTNKRIRAFDAIVAAGAATTFDLQASYPDNCNCHGIGIDIWVGANSASQTAFAFGHWLLVVQPRGGSATPGTTTATINTEVDNPIVWASGSWMANQNPTPIFINPRTSRNIPKGATFRLVIGSSALSAFSVRFHGTGHWFETIL